MRMRKKTDMRTKSSCKRVCLSISAACCFRRINTHTHTERKERSNRHHDRMIFSVIVHCQNIAGLRSHKAAIPRYARRLVPIGFGGGCPSETGVADWNVNSMWRAGVIALKGWSEARGN